LASAAPAGVERGDRLADRRLHAPELSRRRRKAAFVGDRDQHAQLIQRERVDHVGPAVCYQLNC
jgi:hypothetical protein